MTKEKHLNICDVISLSRETVEIDYCVLYSSALYFVVKNIRLALFHFVLLIFGMLESLKKATFENPDHEYI